MKVAFVDEHTMEVYVGYATNDDGGVASFLAKLREIFDEAKDDEAVVAVPEGEKVRKLVTAMTRLSEERNSI